MAAGKDVGYLSRVQARSAGMCVLCVLCALCCVCVCVWGGGGGLRMNEIELKKIVS